MTTSAQFTVVSGGQVDVVVPDIPPGVYVVHAILAPTVGRASYWDGFSVLPTGGASQPTPCLGGCTCNPGGNLLISRATCCRLPYFR